MRIPENNQTTTTNVVCSEEELKKENERAFIMSCLVCMWVKEIAEMLKELEIWQDVLQILADEYGYWLD